MCDTPIATTLSNIPPPQVRLCGGRTSRLTCSTGLHVDESVSNKLLSKTECQKARYGWALVKS